MLRLPVVAVVTSRNRGPVSVRPVLLGSMPGVRHSLPLRVRSLGSWVADSADTELVVGLPRTRPRPRSYVGGPGWDTYLLPTSVIPLASLGGAGNALAAAAGL